MRKVGVGLVGCGVIGVMWAKVISQLDSTELVAACDPDLEKGNSLGAKFKVKCFSNHRDLLQMAEVEVLLVASPASTHGPITVESCQVGKHVYCEKPMALSLKECDRMIQAAKENKVKLMVGQVLRFFALIAETKRIVDSGVLGEPVSIFILRFWDKWDYADWRTKKDLSGGLLIEFDIHELDFMRYICGDVEAVFAMMGNSGSGKVSYQDIAFVLLHFNSGAMGCLHSNLAAELGGFDLKIQGRKGTLSWDFRQGVIKYKTMSGQSKQIELEVVSSEDPYKQAFGYFIESIQKDKEPIVSGLEGKRAIELAEAAYLSAKRKELVRLPLNE